MRKLSVFIIMFIATAATAQHVTTHKVDITLVDTTCTSKLSAIHLVQDEKDRHFVSIPQDPADLCHYTKELPLAAFEVDKTIFSVRFGRARSDCRVAREKPDKADPRLSVGELTFVYKPQSARNLSMTLLPATYRLHYVRTLPGIKGVSVPCREIGDLGDGEKVDDVAFSMENLTVQFLSSPAERGAIWIALDRAIQNQAKKRKPVPLTADLIGDAHVRQNFVDTNENRQIRVDEQSLIARKLKSNGFKHFVPKLE